MHVGTSEPIDGLFRIANQEQRASADSELMPRPRWIALTCNSPEDFGLQRIGILKLIHQNAGIACCESGSYWRVISEKVPVRDVADRRSQGEPALRL